ncbi:uncharacterized protein LOC108039141 [Drosophila rhopaloa]|uniref:Uncharacterized protein LOC108039141 n=1 Tax=Drosophila rhopaloa TaxID=1041015 RepID=A0A6P4E0R7_DRORH|nr:uncharacterized protein LOC108039141 [Drosophila rhopaloa]
MCAMKLPLVVCLILTAALLLGQGHGIPVEVDVPAPDSNDLDTDFDEASEKTLGTVSIKVRHIQTDPALCEDTSRYHPHYPQCHSYCKHQGHWIGQCKKKTCQCFS